MIEAHATVLNQTGIVFVTDEDPQGHNISLQFAPWPCYVMAQQHPRSKYIDAADKNNQ